MKDDNAVRLLRTSCGMPLRRAILMLCLCLPGWPDADAQLFPGLVGEDLVEEIQIAFTPAIVLNETQAKDTLYARIFIVQDSVRCIYSGLARYLPDGVDPSQWLFGTGLEVSSLNLEHSWPQAKGAGEGTKGNTDMHHLFPSRTEINSDRANHPFSEIQDVSTLTWYYQDQQMNSIPQTNRDAYSEYMPLRFEPRESVKGDIARAMMYFWTMYRDDAEAADPAFFMVQREALCAWHVADPVDQMEMDRTVRIATYQDEKTNPFILDCSLALRAYCPEQPDCGTVSVREPSKGHVTIEFNPVPRQYRIVSKDLGNWIVSITDALGRVLKVDQVEAEEWMNIEKLPPALYIITATNGKSIGSLQVVITE